MKHGCVLVSDSHSEMLGAVRGLVHDLFETVIMVADEASLLAALPMLRPDLVVMDFSLPTVDGRNAVTRCAEQFPLHRIIALSLHDEAEAAAATMRAGACAYVLKRAAATDLPAVIRGVLNGGSYISPGVGQRPR